MKFINMKSIVAAMTALTTVAVSASTVVDEAGGNVRGSATAAATNNSEVSFYQRMLGKKDDDNIFKKSVEEYCASSTAVTAETICGMTIDYDIELTNDIICEEKDGPTLVDGASINCNGYTLQSKDVFLLEFQTLS